MDTCRFRDNERDYRTLNGLLKWPGTYAIEEGNQTGGLTAASPHFEVLKSTQFGQGTPSAYQSANQSKVHAPRYGLRQRGCLKPLGKPRN